MRSSSRCWQRRALLAFLAAAALFASPCLAMDQFEIQVYEGDHDDPGEASVELHSNYTIAGHQEPSYPGEVPPNHVLHLALEPALGVTRWLELGAYLQGFVAPDNGTRYGGWKLRAKLLLPERLHLPIILGLNIEVANMPRAMEEAAWSGELRPIIGVAAGRLVFSINPIIGLALTGPEAGRPDLEPALKARWNTNLGFAVGIEHYASLGRFDQGPLGLHQQQHLTFAVLDLEPAQGQPESGWELSLACGRSMTDATPQRWLVKAILGRAF